MKKSKTPHLDAWLAAYPITHIKDFELQQALIALVQAIKTDLS